MGKMKLLIGLLLVTSLSAKDNTQVRIFDKDIGSVVYATERIPNYVISSIIDGGMLAQDGCIIGLIKSSNIIQVSIRKLDANRTEVSVTVDCFLCAGFGKRRIARNVLRDLDKKMQELKDSN